MGNISLIFFGKRTPNTPGPGGSRNRSIYRAPKMFLAAALVLALVLSSGDGQTTVYLPMGPPNPDSPAAQEKGHQPCLPNVSVHHHEPSPQAPAAWKLHKISKVSTEGVNVLSVNAEPGYAIVSVFATSNLVVQDLNFIAMTDTQASFTADVGGAGKIICLRALALRIG